ncbi:MAG: sulfite oxidase [Thermomicrobiales bacterium]|nr:sulfite oxidase [Thermomicrobiales bacterium]
MTIPDKDPRLTPYGTTNLGMDLGLIDSLIVPNDLFFVRSNGAIPNIDRDSWSLTIDGAVSNPLTIDFATLAGMPSRTLTAFLECTGNGRTRFAPEAEGTPWLNDAAGNAVWKGVSLASLLCQVCLLDEAVDVVSQGADLPDMRRGLPLQDALDPDVLLVYEMNGEPLPAAHGGPVRLLVPGWAGIASTKWLTRLEVWDRPFTGEYQGNLYVVYDENGDPVAPITRMPVKSVIRSPREGDLVAPGTMRVDGFAWSGYAAIDRVEVTSDGGATWQPASITDSAGPHSWCRWEASVSLPAGTQQLSVRATDQRGIRQPWEARWNQKGYQMNAIHTITLRVAE